MEESHRTVLNRDGEADGEWGIALWNILGGVRIAP